MNKNEISVSDPRWGGYCPWFLRHNDFSGTGNFLNFFERLSYRITQLLDYESGIQNQYHFATKLVSKSLGRFKYYDESRPVFSITKYFSVITLKKEVSELCESDPDVIKYSVQNRGIRDITGPRFNEEYFRLKSSLEEKYYRPLFIERIGVLEILIQILPRTVGYNDFLRDIRCFLAESQIMLDIDTETSMIKLLEEPMLQREVIDKLMPRLASKFPERAKELSLVYHEMIGGEKKFDEIFLSAFKTLEELARQITNDNKFEFNKECIRKYFSTLHPTIWDTMQKLAGHRGDKGGHGRNAPKPHEMRYLLYSDSIRLTVPPPAGFSLKPLF